MPAAVLQTAGVTGACVLNVGTAALGSSGRRGLFKRLHEYRRFDAGEQIAHWGGRYIWQMSDSSTLLVVWRETLDQDPRLVEQAYINDFIRHSGKRPFANLTD